MTKLTHAQKDEYIKDLEERFGNACRGLLAVLVQIRWRLLETSWQDMFPEKERQYLTAIFVYLEGTDHKATTCTKCGGSGDFVASSGRVMGICYGCKVGRLVGMPGKATLVDRIVQDRYESQKDNYPNVRRNRMEQQAPDQGEEMSEADMTLAPTTHDLDF